MQSATIGQQTKALVQKSWVLQKRNIGSNICLCATPIFFCLILAIIQVLVNNLLLNGDDFKCGCFCEQCCPDWALTSQPGNYTSDGQGNVTIADISTFGGSAALAAFDPATVTNNADGSVTIRTCSPIANGACPSELDYSCIKKDSSRCGVQFSSYRQAQYCGVPEASAWPGVLQTPSTDARAAPWGATVVNGSTTVPRTAVLVTGADTSLVTAAGARLIRNNITTSAALWSQATGRLYSGSATDPAQGNVFNGDMLSLLGLQFGTDVDPQASAYVERAFQPGEELYVFLSAGQCTARGISTGSKTCLAGLLRQYFASDSTVPASVLAELPACSATVIDTNASRLLTATQLRVQCTENEVVAQASSTALEDTLYCGFYQARCNGVVADNSQFLGGVDFRSSALGALDVDVYYNETLMADSSQGNPATPGRIAGSLSDTVAAWWAATTGDTDSAIQMLGIMSTPKQSSKLELDFASLLGPLFYTWVVQLLLPTFLQQLVYEKEKRLRMMMKMHGLGDTSYWLVTYLWYLLLYCIYIIVFIVFGAVINLKIFRKTDIGIQIIFYFLFGNCMISMAFMLSSLFSSARTAVTVAFLYVFASGLIGNLLLETFMGKNKLWVFFVQWVPAWSLYRGLYEMSQYTFLGVYRKSSGLTFSKLGESGNGMLVTWAIFAVEWALFLLLGAYLEQVVSSGNGVSRHPLFFLDGLRRKREVRSNALTELGSLADRGSRPSLEAKLQTIVDIGPSGPAALSDVVAEKARVEAMTDYNDSPITVKDICKIYPGQDGGKPKVAVKSLTLGISRGECFGLLGPNGAGKTTSINMLTGFLEPTSGTAVVEGYDIRTDMQSIYKLMGVCPQHDLLWEQLTGREHLRFYGRLKGMNGPALEESIDAALKAVNLYNAGWGNKAAGKYSGGMKRRLSVAISFIGNPQVVYLDEPSTGLDPASRRNLWDVVKGSKAGRSIILTTHSMEEAEQLCDRLGIFVDGRLVCIGNPKEITSRYAGFFVFTISVPPQREEDARALVLSMSPNAVLTYALGGTLKYELPTSEVTLSKVFQTVNAAKAHLGIIDWGVANATLEEVFIKLARNIGATSKDN